MKIQLVSDLHIEFTSIDIEPQAEVLILAGDICVADYFNRSSESPYSDYAVRFLDFFQDLSLKFKNVLYVMGNHEHYNGRFDRSAETLRRILPYNIYLLDDEIFELEGVRFAGTTLWTDCNNGNPFSMDVAQRGMNDFKLIKNVHHTFRVGESVIEHRKSLRFIQSMEPDVVIGHHLPSYRSIDPQYESGPWSKLNPAFASNLDDYIRSSDIKVWIHGHTHSSHDYMIGNTRILANPRGYDNIGSRPENKSFNSNLTFEI